MNIHTTVHTFQTGKGIHPIDLTDRVHGCLKDSGIANGILTVTSRHTTTALVINEFEERLMDDVRFYFDRLVPPGDRYLHNDIHLRECAEDEPENAHSHILAMLLSSSEIIPVVKGELQIGKWQSVIMIELDGPRERNVSIQVLGE
jgi:secondary thiamine-phosphate synthase enzyme